MKNLKEQLKELEKRVVALNVEVGEIGFTVDSVKGDMGGSLDVDSENVLRKVLESNVKADYREIISDYFSLFRQTENGSVDYNELLNFTVALANGKDTGLDDLCPNLNVLISDYFSMLSIFEDGFIVNSFELNFGKDGILESMDEVYNDFLVALRESKLKFRFELYKDFKGYKCAVFEKPVEYAKLSNGDYLLTIPVAMKFFGESGLLASYVMVERLLLEIEVGLGIGSSLKFPSFSEADWNLFDFLEDFGVEIEFDLVMDYGGELDIYDVLVEDETIGEFTEFTSLKRVKDILSIELSESVLSSVIQTILNKRYGVDEFFTNKVRVY